MLRRLWPAFALIGVFSPAWGASMRAPVVDRAPFEWRDYRADQAREIPDARVEAALRMELIRRAARSIDIVQYLQTADGPVGLPLMSALRDAANRGVRVRFLTTATSADAMDVLHKFRKRLLGIPTLTPIQCLYFGPRSPWSRFDAIHEKLLVVDGRWAITGGRAYGETYLHWLDDGFVVKGPLAEDAGQAYERIWRFANLQERAGESLPLPQGASAPGFRHYLVPPMMGLSAEQRAQEQDYERWLDDAAGTVTGRARVIHYDMLQQRWMNHFPRNLAARIAQLSDPILEALIERISRPSAREILVSSMSLIEHPELKKALTDAARRGARVRMVTNSRHSDAILAPVGLNYFVSLPDMLDLLSAGVEIGIFDSAPASHAWRYLHKKLAIVDDDVFVGSHNFNLPSTLYNDETDFEIEDAAFARSVRQTLEAEMAVSTRPAGASRLSWELWHGARFVRGIKWWLGRVMFPLF